MKYRPEFPDRFKFSLAAIGAGIALAILFGFGSEFLDDRIRGEQALGTGPAGQQGFMRDMQPRLCHVALGDEQTHVGLQESVDQAPLRRTWSKPGKRPFLGNEIGWLETFTIPSLKGLRG